MPAVGFVKRSQIIPPMTGAIISGIISTRRKNLENALSWLSRSARHTPRTISTIVANTA
jgi:hypothetical protein